MPGITKDAARDAVGCPPDPADVADADAELMAQPRQPTSLQGLLRFAMEATRAEDAPGASEVAPMEPERRQFLEEALKSMTVDVTQIIKDSIDTLKTVEATKSEEEISKCLSAIETILDYVDNIDVANDFQKLGGLDVLWKCLCCENEEIKTGACEVVAELCQNNPYCQRFLTEERVISLLLKIVDDETADKKLITKALYAISALIRENLDGLKLVKQNGGLSTLLKALKRDDEKWNSKITFLLGAMSYKDSDLISDLVSANYVPTLIDLVAKERKASHEQVLNLLSDLVKADEKAAEQCLGSEHDVKAVLRNYLEKTEGKPECDEERLYCNNILEVLQKVESGRP